VVDSIQHSLWLREKRGKLSGRRWPSCALALSSDTLHRVHEKLFPFADNCHRIRCRNHTAGTFPPPDTCNIRSSYCIRSIRVSSEPSFQIFTKI